MKKLFFLTMLFIYITSLVTHHSATATQEPLSIPKMLVDNSEYIENLISINPDPSISIPNTTQNTVDQLAKIYNNETNILPHMTITELVHATNLENYLLLKQPKNDLVNELINRIKTTPLNQLIPLQELNPDTSLKIMHTIIKEEHVDSYLLKHYSNWLAKNPKIIENNIKESYSSSEDLLFFNDHIKIYGIIYGMMSEPDVYNRIVIKQKNMPTKEINFPYFLEDLHINVNQNSTYCILYREDIMTSNNRYELWSLTDTPTQYTLDSRLTSYCFANNDTLCSAHSNGTISLFDLKESTHTNITTVELQEYEVIKRLEYQSKTDNKAQTIVALTNKGTIYIIKNNTAHQVSTFSEFPQNNRVYDINLNHAGDYLCVITIPTIVKNYYWSKRPPLSSFLLNISDYENQPTSIFINTHAINTIMPHWTQNDALLTIVYRYSSGGKFYHDYIRPYA